MIRIFEKKTVQLFALRKRKHENFGREIKKKIKVGLKIRKRNPVKDTGPKLLN